MYGRDRGGFNRRSFAPVKVGDEMDVKIEAVGEKGDGIAKKDGFVLFVPNTKAGDEVKIRITKVLRKVGFAEVVGGAQAAPADEEPADSEDFGDAPSEAETEESTEETEESTEEPEESTEETEEEPEEDSEDFGDEDKK